MNDFNDASDPRGMLDRRELLGRSGKLLIGVPLFPSALAAFVSEARGATPRSTLRIAVSRDTETFDASIAAFPRSSEMIYNIYDTLMWWPLRKQGFKYPGAVPAAVKSVKINSQKTLFTFTIPDGMRFASGNPVMVDDFIWTLQRMSEVGFGGFYYGLSSVDVKNPVKRIDDKTFAIASQAPTSLLLEVLATFSFALFDKVEFEKHATTGDAWAGEWAKTNAAGSGPYVVAKRTSGIQTTLTRNPNFTRYKPGFPTVTLPIVPSAADRIALLQRGDVDIAEDIPKERIADLAKNPKLQVISGKAIDEIYIVMNIKRGPFKNKKLRQAINYAIPYDQILKFVYFGYAQRLPGPIPTGARYHDRSAFYYKTDTAKATRLAKASGVTPTSVKLVFDPSRPEYEPIARIVRSALAPLGIDVKLIPTSSARFEEGKFKKEWDFFIDFFIPFVDDPAYYLPFFKTGDFSNYSQFSNSRFDRLLDQLRVEVVPVKRAAIARELNSIVVDSAPYIWLAQPDLTYIMRQGLAFYPHPESFVWYAPIRAK